ncbi:MAG TPA: class I SAM-dependent methyltransferase [Steroidobacteraceae bacterium]|jgi:predicted O-methyltransferase YrrM
MGDLKPANGSSASVESEDGISARWIARLFEHPDLLRMGHRQRGEDRNLGLGWLYYALGRILRPRLAVVIGSWRGFVPLVMAKALQDNLEQGELIFIDPSLADDFWKDADRVQAYFREFGVRNVRHFRMTTQEFVAGGDYRALGEIGLVFIDGRHTEEQVRFDYESFAGLLAPRGFVLFHDSMVVRDDKVYGAENAYPVTVKHFVDRLKEDRSLQLLDLPFGATGLTVLRKLDGESSRALHDWLDGPP